MRECIEWDSVVCERVYHIGGGWGCRSGLCEKLIILNGHVVDNARGRTTNLFIRLLVVF